MDILRLTDVVDVLRLTTLGDEGDKNIFFGNVDKFAGKLVSGVTFGGGADELIVFTQPDVSAIEVEDAQAFTTNEIENRIEFEGEINGQVDSAKSIIKAFPFKGFLENEGCLEGGTRLVD